MTKFEKLVNEAFQHWPEAKRRRLTRSIHSAIGAIDSPQAPVWKPIVSVTRMRQNANLSEFQAISVLATLVAEMWRCGEGPAHDAMGRMLEALEREIQERENQREVV
jgi:hypothetical protein